MGSSFTDHTFQRRERITQGLNAEVEAGGWYKGGPASLGFLSQLPQEARTATDSPLCRIHVTFGPCLSVQLEGTKHLPFNNVSVEMTAELGCGPSTPSSGLFAFPSQDFLGRWRISGRLDSALEMEEDFLLRAG